MHFHAIIRLDGWTPDESYAPPPGRWTAGILADAIKAAAASASVTADVGTTGRTLLVRFGAQTDTTVIRSGTSDVLTPMAVANYIAKYATKTAGAPGLPSYRIRSALELQALRCAPHYRRIIETCWALGYHQWAHCLGYGGHYLTKSPSPSASYAPHAGSTAARSATQMAS